MSKAIPFPMNRETEGERTIPALALPGPRIWTPKDLADFLRVSVSWVHRRTQRSSADPPPRCPGLSDLRFDTESAAFRDWLARQIIPAVDTGQRDE